MPPAKLATPFDLASVAFSTGLGVPGGSALSGSRDPVNRAVRVRRMQGGAMRQVGIFAAAALHAIDHNMGGLAEDHANARRMAEILAESQHVVLDPSTVHTNIPDFSLAAEAPEAASVVDAAREQGVLIFAFGPRTIRAVTHRDASRDQCKHAARVLAETVSD
jgi:threonine aldolase